MPAPELFLGLDVGGTHTDAVLVGERGIVSHYKAITDHDNLLLSVRRAIEEIAGVSERKHIRRINLSTTLSTNAIVEDRLEDVCVIVSAGPGIDPEHFRIGRYYHAIGGSINHRGDEIAAVDAGAIGRITAASAGKGVTSYAVASKFSTRNPDHELRMAAAIRPPADFITLGHRLSGQLSFPRRIVTAYFNSAVWRLYNSFADAIASALAELGVKAEVNVLKADGGTMPFGVSRGVPVESILSGPAASVMGVAALCDVSHDAIMLDIGGTTTDIAVFADGVPLIEREGIHLQAHPTLVRALKTRSIGVGGDSVIRVKGGAVTVGPERKGPAMADGGAEPTLVDALNARKVISYGDASASSRGIADLAKKAKGLTPAKLADAAIAFAVDRIGAEVDAMLEEINNRPVYTIHEMLEGKKIAPAQVYAMGGPAAALRGALEGRFGVGVTLPDHYDVANAVGAALARTTVDIELFADTGRGVMMIPAIDVRERVPAGYTLSDAERDVKKRLAAHLEKIGLKAGAGETEIIESSSFNMVEGWSGAGRDIRVKCQIKPGVTRRLV